MSGKTEKKYLFEIDLNWLSGKTGILSAKDAEGSVRISTPPQFGGEGKPWTPEHLFLGSISSCFMTTFLSFATKLSFRISRFECSVIGLIELDNGKYKFTRIDLYPKIHIDDRKLMEKAGKALEKTHKYCLVTNSINSEIFYHSEILLDETFPEDPGIKAIQPVEINHH